MSGNFEIDPLNALDIQKNDYSVENDLALVKAQLGEWELIDLRKHKAPPSSQVIQGEKLVHLMKAAANGTKLPEQLLNEKDYQDLTNDPKFRGLCRLVPGMETQEHIESRARGKGALGRAFESAKKIGKGLHEITKQGIEGRHVGEDQPEHSYWIREVVFAGSSRPVGEIDILIKGWEHDKTTRLSIREWEAEKIKEWDRIKPGQDFLPWIAAQAWNARTQAAWEKAHPGEVYDKSKLISWKESEEDPDLVLPVWLLKEFAGTSNDADFAKWKTNVLDERKEVWEKFKKETGLGDLSFKDHERLSFEHSISGSVENFARWTLNRLWVQARTRENDPTNDNFPTFVRRLHYQQNHPGTVVESKFQEWCKQEDNQLHIRHEGSHLPFSFEQWKMQQDDGLLIDPAPFILLNEEERFAYRTTCANGLLVRNGHPLNTGFDKTRHSGNGYAIFVIGPDKNLYCGSHIGNVFHHSSFLGEGAIVAAGEVKTAPDGSIIELSSKSGHYQPKEPQNLYMLRYFRDRGVDLSYIKFTSFGEDGKTVERNALEYLNELETGGISLIDSDIFT